MKLNTSSLEDWYPGIPDEVYREVIVTERYTTDGADRVSVIILEGPEKGRIISGLSPTNIK